MYWDDAFDWNAVNFTPLVLGGLISRSALAWVLGMRNKYTGPVRTIEFDEGMGTRRSRSLRPPRAPRTGLAGAAMKLDELKKASRRGHRRHGAAHHRRHGGAPAGQAPHRAHFLDEVAEHEAEGCNYLLAVDVDMNTVSGYEMSSWQRGYGDFVMKPDLDTLRAMPWHDGTALLMADLEWEDGADVVASPRQILRSQLDRLAERGWKAAAGTELEFILFNDSYEEAWQKGYRDLDPANLYNVDYSMLGTARVEPLIRRIRNSMMGAGLRVENSKGECNFGQHEINFRYDEALATADDHAIYKNGAKEIAAQEGMAITFMAKLDEREGNSCHIHCSLQNDGGNVFADDEATFNQLRRRPARVPAGADAVLRAARQPRTSASCTARSRRRRWPGARQPHLLDAGGRPRPVAARREPPAGRRRQPVPGAGGDDRGGPARDRREARARAGVRGQRLRLGQAARAAHAVRGARPVRGTRRSRATPSARRWSTTT